MAKIDYGQEILDRLPRHSPIQDDGNPGNILVRDVLGLELARCEEAIWTASDLRFLERATGKYLDYWGQLLKIPRSLGMGKVNLLTGSPVWDNVSSGSDFLGGTQGLSGMNGVTVKSSTDWAARGQRSFKITMPGTNLNEYARFLPFNNEKLPIQQGDFREIAMTIRGMPQQHNYAHPNVATATSIQEDTTGFDPIGAVFIHPDTTEKLDGFTRSLEVTISGDPANQGVRFGAQQVDNPNAMYATGVWIKAPTGFPGTIHLHQRDSDDFILSVVGINFTGTGGWQFVQYPIQFDGGTRLWCYVMNRVFIAGGTTFYVGAAGIVKGDKVYGIPNPATGVLEQRLSLRAQGVDSYGGVIEEYPLDVMVSGTPIQVVKDFTLSNPAVVGMSWNIHNNSVPNPLLVYVDGITVDDGQFYQNWDDTTYRQKLLANVGRDITTASVKKTLASILECDYDDISIVTPEPEKADITIPWGSDIALIEALIDDMLLPNVEATITEV